MVYAPAERADALPLFLLYPYVHSVVVTPLFQKKRLPPALLHFKMQTKLTEEGGLRRGCPKPLSYHNQYPAVRTNCAKVAIKKRLLSGSMSLRDAYFCQRVG